MWGVILETLMEYSGATYEGAKDFGRMDGNGTFTFPDGSFYVGQFKDGQFHGKGVMTFTDGSKFEGSWKEGDRVDGQFSFADGLAYSEDKNWSYCTESSDRRFHSEIESNTIRPAGELSYYNNADTKPVPVGFYDTGNGFYDPSKNQIISKENPDEILQEDVSKTESKWIQNKAILGM